MPIIQKASIIRRCTAGTPWKKKDGFTNQCTMIMNPYRMNTHRPRRMNWAITWNCFKERNMGFHVNRKKGKPPVLTLEGDVGIGEAAELRNEIMGVMNESDSLTVDIGNIEKMDISCVQLLCAANRSFEKKSKVFKIDRGKNDMSCRTVLTGTGYDKNGGCHEKICKNCLWKGAS
jgi:ABC-type transporter Mla MlaB component